MLWVSELPGARWPPCADVRLRWLATRTRHLAFIYIYGHNSLAPPPHAGHEPGHLESLQVSQRGCVGHFNTYSMPKLIPQLFNWVEVWTHGRPFHSLPDGVLWWPILSLKLFSQSESQDKGRVVPTD